MKRIDQESRLNDSNPQTTRRGIVVGMIVRGVVDHAVHVRDVLRALGVGAADSSS
jgi:hypothetical protein